MNYENTAQNKSRDFSIRIIRVYQYLCKEKHEFVLSKQLLRSGTSIGANLAEAKCASSRKDFLSKVYIALKECAEACYWLDLLHETGYLTDKGYHSLQTDCLELRKILTATTHTIASEDASGSSKL